MQGNKQGCDCDSDDIQRGERGGRVGLVFSTWGPRITYRKSDIAASYVGRGESNVVVIGGHPCSSKGPIR